MNADIVDIRDYRITQPVELGIFAGLNGQTLHRVYSELGINRNADAYARRLVRGGFVAHSSSTFDYAIQMQGMKKGTAVRVVYFQNNGADRSEEVAAVFDRHMKRC